MSVRCYLNAYNVRDYSCTFKTIYLSTVRFFCRLHFLCTQINGYCATRYLCNAIQQIVLEMSCGCSLFPHFQITFSSVALDFKRFSQNISRKMISIKKISTLKKPDVAICYSKDFNREFRSNLTYFQNNLFRANFKKLFECSKICYYFLL